MCYNVVAWHYLFLSHPPLLSTTHSDSFSLSLCVALLAEWMKEKQLVNCIWLIHIEVAFGKYEKNLHFYDCLYMRGHTRAVCKADFVFLPFAAIAIAFCHCFSSVMVVLWGNNNRLCYHRNGHDYFAPSPKYVYAVRHIFSLCE